MKFTDSVEISGTRIRSDGYLVADAQVARTGIQLYAGYEVGKLDMDVVRVYRPGSEVFSDETLKSFAHIPVTNDHPSEAVTADNWKTHAVGNTSDEITGQGISIRVPLMISDGAAIKDVENGKRELSAGYSSKLVWEAGVTDNGEEYDAIQTNILANHIAIVDRGRAGSEYRIGDNAVPAKWGRTPLNVTDEGNQSMPDNLKTVTVDGLSVQTTDAGAVAITKLLTDLKSSAAKFDKTVVDHTAVVAAHDTAVAKLDAEIADLKKKVLSDKDIDKRVTDKATLIAQATTIVKDGKFSGMSDADIRREVVKTKNGAEAVTDKSDEYVQARFDIIVEDSKVDPAQNAFKGVTPPAAAITTDHGQQGYEDRLSRAWETKTGEAA